MEAMEDYILEFEHLEAMLEKEKLLGQWRHESNLHISWTTPGTSDEERNAIYKTLK